MVAQAMSRADLVIIPTEGSELDAIEAIKVIKFIGRQESKRCGADIWRFVGGL